MNETNGTVQDVVPLLKSDMWLLWYMYILVFLVKSILHIQCCGVNEDTNT